MAKRFLGEFDNQGVIEHIGRIFSAVAPFMLQGGVANAAMSSRLPGVDVPDVWSFIRTVLCSIAAWMFWILIAMSVVFFLIAAWRYLLSSGDSEKIHKATQTLTYGAIAIVVALMARVIPIIIITIFPSTTGIDTGSNICG